MELPQIMTALTATIGVLLAALGASFGYTITQLSKRVDSLESEVTRAETYNRKLWNWARKHYDLYYTWRREGSPLPDDLPED